MEKNKGNLWTAISLAWELGYTIAIPLILFAFLGVLADKKFGTLPGFTILGIFAAATISSILVYKKVVKIISKY